MNFYRYIKIFYLLLFLLLFGCSPPYPEKARLVIPELDSGQISFKGEALYYQDNFEKLLLEYNKELQKIWDEYTKNELSSVSKDLEESNNKVGTIQADYNSAYEIIKPELNKIENIEKKIYPLEKKYLSL